MVQISCLLLILSPAFLKHSLDSIHNQGTKNILQQQKIEEFCKTPQFPEIFNKVFA
jgi:hypothetical protein